MIDAVSWPDCVIHQLLRDVIVAKQTLLTAYVYANLDHRRTTGMNRLLFEFMLTGQGEVRRYVSSYPNLNRKRQQLERYSVASRNSLPLFLYICRIIKPRACPALGSLNYMLETSDSKLRSTGWRQQQPLLYWKY